MNILFYGGHYWDRGPWFRKQHFAERLSKLGHTIFYIEDSVSIIRKDSNDKNHYFKIQYKKINNNLYIITPPTYLPFPNNTLSEMIYYKMLHIRLSWYFKKNNIKIDCLWVCQSSSYYLLKYFGNRLIKVYDVADDEPGYELLYERKKGYIKKFNKFTQLLSLCDVVIVSAKRLIEKYQKFSKIRFIHIPNGHNIDLNILHEHNLDIPNDLKQIPPPRIVHIGTLFKFLDEDLLEYIIKSRPEYNFVFIGKIEYCFDISRFKNYNNFYYLGVKKKEDVLNYILFCDLCINIFKRHEVNESVNPVKIYEYLASNKPIVSTIMDSLQKEKVSKFISFADNYDDFLKLLDKYLKFNIDESYIDEERIQILQYYHYDNLFKSMISEIKKLTNLTF